MPSVSLAPRSAATLTAPPALFAPTSRTVSFPIQHVVIGWERLIAKWPLVLETLNAMPSYLLKPEVLALIKSLKQNSGRASKRAFEQLTKRLVPIADERFKERVQSYLWAGQFKKDEKLFPTVRQTVTRHIHKLVERAGHAPFKITTHTFRNSFAIHLLLHGRPLKYVSQLLGHRSIESTEIYTNMLTVDGTHFLDGVDFH